MLNKIINIINKLLIREYQNNRGSWVAVGGVALNYVRGSSSDSGEFKDSNLVRGLRFDKGKDWWMDSLTGFGILGNGKEKGKSADELFKENWIAPEWEEDPDYRRGQDFLGKLGTDILGGNIPDYYTGIGEHGSQEFEDMLQMTTADVTKSMLEGAAITGRGRGGGLAPQIAEITGDISRKARYDDYMRALGGKEFLFQQGRGITEGVRSAGAQTQSAKNQFNLNVEGIRHNRMVTQNVMQAENSNQWGSLISTGISALGGAYAGYKGGGGVSGAIGGALSGATEGFDWGSLMNKGKSLPSTTSVSKDDELWLGKPYKKLSMN